MLIAGFVMHRIKDIDPMQDTLRKIATISPIVGRVLDTATGLGYTAIEAAKSADEVVTIELDPGVQEIARLIDNNFSFGEVGKRTKGFSFVLLFVFTILNIIVLPTLVYQWTNSTICVLSLIFFGLLFLIGITNKSGTAAYFAAVAFFVIWSLIGFIRVIGYYHFSLPPYWLVIIIFLLSLLQLELFRPRNRRRKFLRII